MAGPVTEGVGPRSDAAGARPDPVTLDWARRHGIQRFRGRVYMDFHRPPRRVQDTEVWLYAAHGSPDGHRLVLASAEGHKHPGATAHLMGLIAVSARMISSTGDPVLPVVAIGPLSRVDRPASCARPAGGRSRAPRPSRRDGATTRAELSSAPGQGPPTGSVPDGQATGAVQHPTGCQYCREVISGNTPEEAIAEALLSELSEWSPGLANELRQRWTMASTPRRRSIVLSALFEALDRKVAPTGHYFGHGGLYMIGVWPKRQPDS
jgi:hypothetical protein